MKKFYFAIVASLLLASFPTFAQKGLYLGVAVSANSVWITNQNNYGLPEMDYSTTFGMAENINVGYDFTNHLGLKIEFGLNRIGEKYHDTKDTITGMETFAREVKLDYFNIPVLFKYRTGGKIVKFYVAVGPQFNFLRTATQTYTKDGVPFSTVLTNLAGKKFDAGAEDIKDRYNAMDIVARMDLGINIMIIQHLMIDFGFTCGYGLKDLNASDYKMGDFSSGVYHPSHSVFGGLTLGVGWHF
ncbi:MAG: outer membrane beta-barrel protein [Bacteroidetes bacterium]|nr:outer membrane beta-barrel protein [Bacteroidota bacterium]